MRLAEADEVGLGALDGGDLLPRGVWVSAGVYADVSAVVSIGCDEQVAVLQLDAAVNGVDSGSGRGPSRSVVSGNGLPGAAEVGGVFVFRFCYIVGPTGDEFWRVGGWGKVLVSGRFEAD